MSLFEKQALSAVNCPDRQQFFGDRVVNVNADVRTGRCFSGNSTPRDAVVYSLPTRTPLGVTFLARDEVASVKVAQLTCPGGVIVKFFTGVRSVRLPVGKSCQFTFSTTINGQLISLKGTVARQANSYRTTGVTAFGGLFGAPPDETDPTLTIQGFPLSFPGLQSFLVTLKFSESVTGFAASDIIVNNGTVGVFTRVNASTYTARITPAGSGNVTVSVPANVAFDSAGNGNQAAPDIVVKNAIAENTSKAIASFLYNRANHILNQEPDLAGLINGSNTNSRPFGSLNLQIQHQTLDFNYAYSLSNMTQKQNPHSSSKKKRHRQHEQVPYNNARTSQSAFLNENRVPSHQDEKFDLWTRVSGSKSWSGANTDSLWTTHFGAHYFVSSTLAIGAMTQLDWAKERDSTTGRMASGFGWMAGPYLVGRIPNRDLFFETRAAWGKSNNKIAPSGTYSDSFQTERWLAKFKLNGVYDFSLFRIDPFVSIIYFEETQKEYLDSFANSIPTQLIKLGEVRFGPKFIFDHEFNDSNLQVTLGASGIWNFAFKRGISPPAFLAKGETVRARFDAGFTFRNKLNWSLAINGFVDGVGTKNYTLFGASTKISIPLN